MKRDVNREIAEVDVYSCRTERPLIRQVHPPIALQSRHDRRFLSGLGLPVLPFRQLMQHKQEQAKQTDGESKAGERGSTHGCISMSGCIRGTIMPCEG